MPSTPSTRTYKTSRQVELDQPVKRSRGLKPKKLPKLPKGNFTRLIFVLLVVLCVFLFLQYRSAQHKLNSNNYDKELKSLSKIIILPQDEKPTTAVVKDATKLKGSALFKNAQNGDLVFIYQKTNRTILYRPSTNMIVDIGLAHD